MPLKISGARGHSPNEDKPKPSGPFSFRFCRRQELRTTGEIERELTKQAKRNIPTFTLGSGTYYLAHWAMKTLSLTHEIAHR